MISRHLKWNQGRLQSLYNYRWKQSITKPAMLSRRYEGNHVCICVKIETTKLLSVQHCSEVGTNWRFEITGVLLTFHLGEWWIFRARMAITFCLLFHLLPKLERVDPRSTRFYRISINHLMTQLCKEGGGGGQGSIVVMTVWMPCSDGRGRLPWYKMSSRYMCKMRLPKYIHNRKINMQLGAWTISKDQPLFCGLTETTMFKLLQESPK